MIAHSFVIVMSGVDFGSLEGTDADRLYERAKDVFVGVEGGLQVAEFDREAATFAEAVGSALRDLELAVPHGKVVRIEPTDATARPCAAAG